MTGEFGTAFIEKVTVPSNNATSAAVVINTLRNLRSNSSTYLVSVRRINSESPAPAQYEIGAVTIAMGSNGASAIYGDRYNGSEWASISSFASAVNGVATEGSVYELVQINLNKLVT